MTLIRWKFVLALSLSGVDFAGLTIIAWIHGLEHWVALLILVGIGNLAAFIERRAPVRNAFVAGFLTAVFALFVQMAFAEQYFQNNPEYLAVPVPFGLSPVVYTILFAPFGGLMAGALAAVVAWPVSSIVRRVFP